ncbi:MAG: glutamate--tRNA ligase, partial [Gammaproteobacteria bacterium]
PGAARKHLSAESLPALEALRARFAALGDWSATAIHAILDDIATAAGAKLGKIAQPLRVAVSGGGVSPPIDLTLEILGRDVTLRRLDRALAWVRTPSS